MGVQHPSDLWPRLRHRVFGRQREPGRCCRKCGHRLGEPRPDERCPECGARIFVSGTFENAPLRRGEFSLPLIIVWTIALILVAPGLTEPIRELVSPSRQVPYIARVWLRCLDGSSLTILANQSASWDELTWPDVSESPSGHSIM